MTEAEWNVCNDPQLMLEFLRGKASDRKLRLFAVACCRRFDAVEQHYSRGSWASAEGPHAEGVVELIEASAESGVCSEELRAARSALEDWLHHLGLAYPGHGSVACALAMASSEPCNAAKASVFMCEAFAWIPRHKVSRMTGQSPGASFVEEGRARERTVHCGLLRDIFGPLRFRRVTVDTSSLTSSIRDLGQVIYDERAFDRLPILADALEEAGCTDPDILEHCRGGGEHVRGCWVVDLLTGRE